MKHLWLLPCLLTGCTGNGVGGEDTFVPGLREPTPEPGDDDDDDGDVLDSCDAGYEDRCFVFRFLDQESVRLVREDPANVSAVFAAYRDELLAALGPAFADLSEDGLRLVFATIVAYEAVPYRAPGTSWLAPLSREDPAALLAEGVGLVCDESSFLAILLFYAMSPQEADSPVQINPIGWGSTSPFGNHAQIFVTGTGVPLLLDPTFGVLARGTLHDLLRGAPLATSPFLSRRVIFQSVQEPIRIALTQPNAAGEGIFQLEESQTGRFRATRLIYSWIARDHAQGGRQIGYRTENFTATCAPNDGWAIACLDASGGLWNISSAGTQPIEPGTRFSMIAAREDTETLYALEDDGDLRELSSPDPVATQIAELAEGRNGTAIYARAEDRTLFEITQASVAPVAIAQAIAEGDGGRAVYYLDVESRVVRLDESGSWTSGYTATQLRPGRGSQSEGSSVFVLTGSGSFVRIDRDGIWIPLAGPGIALDAKIVAFEVGTGNSTTSVLTADGRVRRAGLAALWTEPPWAEGPGTAPFVSITLAQDDFTLLALQSDGQVRSAAASTY